MSTPLTTRVPEPPVQTVAATAVTDTLAPLKIRADKLSFYYGPKRALTDISMDIRTNVVTAFIGPSGCGKSTFLRTLNRMNDIITGARVDGLIEIDRQNIYAPGTDVVALRRAELAVAVVDAVQVLDQAVAAQRLAGEQRLHFGQCGGIDAPALGRLALALPVRRGQHDGYGRVVQRGLFGWATTALSPRRRCRVQCID